MNCMTKILQRLAKKLEPPLENLQLLSKDLRHIHYKEIKLGPKHTYIVKINHLYLMGYFTKINNGELYILSNRDGPIATPFDPGKCDKLWEFVS